VAKDHEWICEQKNPAFSNTVQNEKGYDGKEEICACNDAEVEFLSNINSSESEEKWSYSPVAVGLLKPAYENMVAE
jgi:hypothetical protein